MKVVVASDNHGNLNDLKYILNYEKNVDYFIHCGDSEMHGEEISPFISVRGNNDYFSDFMDICELQVGARKIVFLHGHRLGLYGNAREILYNKALSCNADILCFGHTHTPYHTVYKGIHLLNPGSTSRPRSSSGKTYAVIYIDDEVEVEFHTIK